MVSQRSAALTHAATIILVTMSAVTSVRAVTPADGTIEIHFTAAKDFPDIESNYVPGNLGFVWVWWDSSQTVRAARVLISTTGTSQKVRDHLIREELTQALGLLQDSHNYPESIFYQGWSTVDSYAYIDKRIIWMLYREGVRAGMTPDEAEGHLARYYSRDEMAYFREVALGAEHGSRSGGVLRWHDDATIVVHGYPTANDRAALRTTVVDINALIYPVRLRLDD